MIFVIVTEGEGIAEVDGESVALSAGSMLILPHGQPFRLLSGPGEASVPLFDLPVEKVSERYEIMTLGGGGELVRAMAGVVQFDHVAGKRLLDLLPRMIRIDAWDEALDAWVQSTLGLIAREATSLRPGGETVMTRLADILVIQAIREWIDTAPEARQGWLAALRDAQVGRALALMHRRPEADWTLAGLAREAGMSRSGFAARFTELVGQPAMTYLAQWRLHLARVRLVETGEPVGRIAKASGYQSEAAFSRAFRKLFGEAPGGVRRLAAA